MVQTSRLKKIVIGLVVLLVLLILVVLGTRVHKNYSNSGFRFVSTSPTINDVPNIASVFNIKFSKTLSTSGLSVSARPDIISSYKLNGDTLDISFDTNITGPLKTNQQYIITIGHIADESGSSLNNLSFSFRPVIIQSTQLSPAQQQAYQNEQTNYDKQIEDDPLLSKLPFIGPGLEYEINYTVQYSPTPLISVTVTAPTSAYQQEAISWIESLGVNPSNYHISYITQSVE